MSSKETFLSQIKSKCPDLASDRVEKAALFAEFLYLENSSQNLTRIPEAEFVEGHLRDVLELLSLPSLGKVVLDVGSGGGVPGLLAAMIDEDPERMWLLSESEHHKCEYLARGIEKFRLKNTMLVAGRIEGHAKEIRPDTIIARAVGTVDKIAGWVWDCSTWNNLLLLKSIGWKDEWEKAKTTRFGKKLTVTHEHDYRVGDKFRNVITLKRNKN